MLTRTRCASMVRKRLGITGTSHQFTGLAASTDYRIDVRAVNTAGSSAFTAQLDVTTDATPPGPPPPSLGAPRLTFVLGQTVTADDLNALAAQGTPVFTTEAQRDAAFAVEVANDTMVVGWQATTTSPEVVTWVWDGSGWTEWMGVADVDGISSAPSGGRIPAGVRAGDYGGIVQLSDVAVLRSIGRWPGVTSPQAHTFMASQSWTWPYAFTSRAFVIVVGGSGGSGGGGAGAGTSGPNAGGTGNAGGDGGTGGNGATAGGGTYGGRVGANAANGVIGGGLGGPNSGGGGGPGANGAGGGEGGSSGFQSRVSCWGVNDHG